MVGLVISLVGPNGVVVDDDGRRSEARSIAEVATLPDDRDVTVEVTVAGLWNSSSGNVQQMGRVQDASQDES